MIWGIVELEPEVREWLEELSAARFATAAFSIDLLAEYGPLLSEPHTRQLDGKLRELRFYLDGQAACYVLDRVRPADRASDSLQQGSDAREPRSRTSAASTSSMYR